MPRRLHRHREHRDRCLVGNRRTKPASANRVPAGRKTILSQPSPRKFRLPLEEALSALRAVVDLYPDTAIFFPVHPNPNTKNMAERILGDHPRIALSEPLSYSPLVAAMQASWLIVTDSGGLQEEGPALGKPVLVLREMTERPEALDSGVVRLVGTDASTILQAISELHDDPLAYQSMARPVFPYGDGHAAERIVAAMRGRLLPADEPRVRTDAADPQADEIHQTTASFESC